MGSIDKACISGFLCRLCSEMHRTVIHIYGDQGQKHGLLEKINGYLPVTITPTDPLPKTICESCLRRVEQHYELLIRITKYREIRPRQTRILIEPKKNQATSSNSTSTAVSSERTSPVLSPPHNSIHRAVTNRSITESATEPQPGPSRRTIAAPPVEFEFLPAARSSERKPKGRIADDDDDDDDDDSSLDEGEGIFRK